MLNHEGEGKSEDNDENDDDVFQYLGNGVVEHDAKLSVRHPIKTEQPKIYLLNDILYNLGVLCNETQSPG